LPDGRTAAEHRELARARGLRYGHSDCLIEKTILSG